MIMFDLIDDFLKGHSLCIKDNMAAVLKRCHFSNIRCFLKPSFA